MIAFEQNPVHPAYRWLYPPALVEWLDRTERHWLDAVARADREYQRGRYEVAERWDVEAERRWHEHLHALMAAEEDEEDDPLESAGLEHELARVYHEWHAAGGRFPQRGEDTTLVQILRHVLADFDYPASQRVSDEELVAAGRDAWENQMRLREAYAPPARRGRVA